MKNRLTCYHCKTEQSWDVYTDHVKLCIAEKAVRWDASAYSETYFKQARALSRFKQPGDAKIRNKYKSWAWFLVHRDGPPLVKAEVS